MGPRRDWLMCGLVLAFIVAGLILGGLARALRHGPDDTGLAAALLVGVVGAVVGGCGMDVVLSDGLTEVTAWSFTTACVLSFVALGLLEGGIGRRRT